MRFASSIASGAMADRPIVRVATTSDDSRRLWRTATQLAGELGEATRWAVIGGLMVQLHAFEHQSDSRLTEDVDVLGDSRQRPSMTQHIAELLQRAGAKMEMPSRANSSLAYKFEVDGALVEVLGPDGVRAKPKTVGKYTTFEVPGGTQALNRSEVVMVSVDGEPPVALRRPSLLGAILIKARVVAKERKKKFDSDRQDLVLLLSLIDDPRALATEGELKKTEKRWLRNVEQKLNFSDPTLQNLFSPEKIKRAEQALHLLIG